MLQLREDKDIMKCGLSNASDCSNHSHLDMKAAIRERAAAAQADPTTPKAIAKTHTSLQHDRRCRSSTKKFVETQSWESSSSNWSPWRSWNPALGAIDSRREVEFFKVFFCIHEGSATQEGNLIATHGWCKENTVHTSQISSVEHMRSSPRSAVFNFSARG